MIGIGSGLEHVRDFVMEQIEKETPPLQTSYTIDTEYLQKSNDLIQHCIHNLF